MNFILIYILLYVILAIAFFSVVYVAVNTILVNYFDKCIDIDKCLIIIIIV